MSTPVTRWRPPLLEIERVVVAVRKRVFDPDQTRSGRWKAGYKPESLQDMFDVPEAIPTVDESLHTPDTDLADSAEASQSTSSPSSSAEGDDVAADETLNLL